MTEPAVRRAQQREARWSLARATQAFPALLRIAGDELRVRVHAASEDPALRAARETPEAAQLFVQRLPKEGTDEDWILLSKDGMVVARSANGAKRGASLRGEPAVRTLLTGTPTQRGLYRFEGAWRLLSGVPLMGPLGLEGALLVLRRLDGELAHQLAEGAGAELVFVDGDRVLGTVPSAALADLRQRPWDGAAVGAIDEVHAGGGAWHIVSVGHGGPEELEILLLRQHVLGEDPLADLGMRSGDAWLRPGPVGMALLFASLALFGLWLSGREGRTRRVYNVQSTPLPTPLPDSAFLPMEDSQDDEELPPPVLEEAMLTDEWSHHLENAVDSVLSEPDPAPEPEPAPAPEPDPEEPEPDAEAEGRDGADGDSHPSQPEPEPEPEAEAEAEAEPQPEPEAEPQPEPAPEEDDGGNGEEAEEEEREDTARWGTPVAGVPSARATEPVEEPRSLTVEWTGRYDTPTPLTEALKTPQPEPAAGEPQRKYEQLYVRFLQCRQACGESTEDISYERFERRLDRNAAKVRERYDCDDVRFNIRIVDGRAKIKAIPENSSRASA